MLGKLGPLIIGDEVKVIGLVKLEAGSGKND